LKSRKCFLDRNTAKSRTGYAGFPFTWSSKMQTETASSTTKAELIALSKCQKTTNPLIGLMEEMQE